MMMMMMILIMMRFMDITGLSNCVRQDWGSWPALSGTWRRAAA